MLVGSFEAMLQSPTETFLHMEDNTEDFSKREASALANQIAQFCTGNDSYT